MFNPSHPIPRGLILSLLWLFAILIGIFRGMQELALASTINEILAGQLNGVPVTEAGQAVSAVVIVLLLLPMLLSPLLAARWSRPMNLVLVILPIVGLVMVPPGDGDDYVFAAAYAAALIAIILVAWRWKPDDA